MAYHRALVDSAGNPVIKYQLVGAVEAMQPKINIIVFSAWSRETIIGLHGKIADALKHRDSAVIDKHLSDIAVHTNTLDQSIIDAPQAAKVSNLPLLALMTQHTNFASTLNGRT